MIFTIVGLPGSFTDLCRDVCLALAQRGGRTAAAIEVAPLVAELDPLRRDLDTLGSLGRSLLGSSANHVIAVMRTPDRAFCITVKEAERPFLVAIDDPRSVALQLVERDGLDVPTAVRAMTASSASMTACLGADNGIQITRDEAVRSLPAFAQRLVEFMGLPAGPETEAEALALIEQQRGANPVLANQAVAAVSGPGQLTTADTLTIEAGLSGYWDALQGRKVGAIVATRALFYSNVQAGTPAPATIDVTGRARCLAYGPYINLPEGSWTLRLVLGFSANLAGAPFTVDLIRTRGRSHVEAGRVSFNAVAGPYIAQMAFTNSEPEGLLQFRIFIDHPAFDGMLSIGYAELRPTEMTAETSPGLGLEWTSGIRV